MTPESRGSQDLLTYLRIFWRWKFLFLAFLVLIPLAAYLVERGKPKVYQSSTLIQVEGNLAPNTTAVVASQNLAAVATLVTTTSVAKKAALFMTNPPANPTSLLGEVTATPDETTGFLTIAVQDHNPQRAAEIATAFADAIGSFENNQELRSLDVQLAALAKQLNATPLADPVSRAAITEQIAALRSEPTGGNQVIQAAVPNPNPVGPKTERAVLLAFVIALLLGVGAVLIAENSDRRLRTPEDLETLTELRLLGVIPRTAFLPERLGDARDEEAFQMLRASLSYFSVDRPLKSIGIISPLVGDGKTTVAAGLAVASARAGKRVILLDADLRRPQVCARLGIESSVGLAGVLSGQAQLEDVLIEYDIGSPEEGQLLVLPGGPPPPNPSALISSNAMRDLLERLEDKADIVIIDTAAALAVSDAIPLVQRASGIAVIVRMNRSSSAAVKRLQKVIAEAKGSPMGVVATGQPAAAGYGNYYYYRYTDREARRRRRLGRLFGFGRNGHGAYEPALGTSRPATPKQPETDTSVSVGDENGSTAAAADGKSDPAETGARD